MWVSERTFMELIERVVRAENKAAEALRKAEEAESKARVANVKIDAVRDETEKMRNMPLGKSIDVPQEDAKTKGMSNAMLEELLNGIPDETTGRVRYTDGRE